MRPTRWPVLTALGLGFAALAWGVLRVLDARSPTNPPMPWTVPLGLLFVALGVLVSAATLRRRLRGDLLVRPIDALSAARLVALAKASAHAGAVLAGLYAGVVLFLLPGAQGGAGRGRLGLAALSVLAALGLTAAGLLLERVTRVDPPEDELST